MPRRTSPPVKILLFYISSKNAFCRTWYKINSTILADLNNEAIRRWVEEAALTIATGNNNNIDESKLGKNNNNNNNNNKSPVDGKLAQENAKLGAQLNSLPASWFLNLNNKLVEAGNLGLIAGNIRNYHHHLAGKLSELSGKAVDVPRILPEPGDGNRLSPGSIGEGKSSPSSRESPLGGTYESSPTGTLTEERPEDTKSSPSPIWPAWWSSRNPSPSNLLSKSSQESPGRGLMPMLVHPPSHRSHDDQPLDFSVSTKNPSKFKPKMTISQTKALISNLQNGHLNLKKTHSHRLINNNNNNHHINNNTNTNSVRHRQSFKSSSSSSAGSEDEGVGPPSSSLGSPGPLQGDTGKLNYLYYFNRLDG
ncbi:hypothetical protein RUM43_009884 [Polyplax serrata]|uniref:Uncharacterized protein n=1 Tax=Polyplax serrata TaxID=468196 RepID=A0AAN8PV17_POLSC